MIDCGSLEYAQARLQARHGQRADESSWQRLETAREFAALLDAARNSPLRAWVAGLTPHSGAHEIDHNLRGHWRATVAEVRGWMPPAWQAALAWCALWPQLPALQHLARGGAVAGWMHDDADLRALCAAAPAERPAVLAAGPLAPLASAWSAPSNLGTVWLQAWQQRLPRGLCHRAGGGDGGDGLARLRDVLQAHAVAFSTAAGQGPLLRRALRARLAQLLRRCTAQPAAAFVHLSLCALDLERLRGELLARALFARLPGAGAS